MKSYLKFIILFVIFNLLHFNTIAQEAVLKFQRYSVIDGLSNSFIRIIAQDKQGFIWIGTDKGLNRFDGYSFKHYFHDENDPNSLGENMVTELFVDSKGRMWVCGPRIGNFQMYDPDQDQFISVLKGSNNKLIEGEDRVWEINEDRSGRLWLVTFNGIRIFDPENPKMGLQKFGDISHLDFPFDNDVSTICFDSRNHLWIATSSALVQYDLESGSYQIIQHDNHNPRSLSSNNIQEIVEDQLGNIWIATFDAGLNLLSYSEIQKNDTKPFNFITFTNDPSNPTSIASNNIFNMQFDTEGNLWIGTDNGISRLNKLPEIDINYNPEKITFDNHKFNPIDQESIGYNFVQKLFFDRSGVLWVGTSVGLDKQKGFKFGHVKMDISHVNLGSNKIQTIFEDNTGKIWLGSSKGLSRYNPITDEVSLKMEGAIMSISQDSMGYLWIGTWQDGLIRFDPESEEREKYSLTQDNSINNSSPSIFYTYIDQQENLWICTWGEGLYQYNWENDNFISFRHNEIDDQTISSDFVGSIFEDSEGEIWVGTQNGLNLLTSKDKGTFKNLFHSDDDVHSISSNYINCFNELQDGTLWIGTNEGLNKLNREDMSFTSYSCAKGMLEVGIMGILNDEQDNLWISTYDGLLKVCEYRNDKELMEELETSALKVINSCDGNIENKLFIKSYGIDDGIQSSEFVVRSCLNSSTGEMYFGGINGFNIFNPDNIHDNHIPPAVVFTDFQLYNKSVLPGEVINKDTILSKQIEVTNEVILSHRNKVFSVEFAALSFNSPEHNSYQYMLEGFDDNWYSLGINHKVSFSNLDQGDYILRVKAANSDGVWSKNDAKLKITIIPPFWKTWWFKFVLILSVTISTFIFIKIRIYSLIRQKKVLEEKVKVRTSEIVRQKNQIVDQAERIRKMNKVLKKHNLALEENVATLSEARVMQKLISFKEFKKIYLDENACYQFVEQLKWKEGYNCKNCGGHEYSKSQDNMARRCKKCNYVESVTSSTLFHRLRFPIDKAFYILILTSTGRELNISKISKEIDLRLKTCWEFHKKVKEIMQNYKRFKYLKEGWKEIILYKKKE